MKAIPALARAGSACVKFSRVIPQSKGDRDEGSVFVLAAGAAIVAGSILATLQAQGGQGAPAQPMGFFVTSVGLEGGNLGGLQGADAHCQKLAAASGREGAGNRVWRADLSTQGPNAVNARDRIGSGPWANARGGVVARDVAHLHGDTVELAQLGSNLTKTTALTERPTGPRRRRYGTGRQAAEPARHSDRIDQRGPGVPAGEDKTCNNWTSNATGSAQVGHSTVPAAATRRGTSLTEQRLQRSESGGDGGNGYFYCFAEK